MDDDALPRESAVPASAPTLRSEKVGMDGGNVWRLISDAWVKLDSGRDRPPLWTLGMWENLVMGLGYGWEEGYTKSDCVEWVEKTDDDDDRRLNLR